MMHALSGLGMRSVSTIAVDVPAVTVGTKRMKLVISAKSECPAGLPGQPGPTARTAPEIAYIGAGVAVGCRRGRTVKTREHLLEVMSQFRQLLSKLVECGLGRHGAFSRDTVASAHVTLRFRPQLMKVASLFAAVPNARAKCTPPATLRHSPKAGPLGSVTGIVR
jgi:hypothetical protein